MAPHDTDDPDLRWSRLMAQAQDGDRPAYERLLREIQPLIRKIVASGQRSPDRIEDVVQDVLLTVHRVRHTYDPARPFRHWLAAIARRRSIDALRRRGRVEAWELSDEIAYETSADPRANREMAARDQEDSLVRALASLPSAQREAVELLKLREMSLIEASSVTGRSIGSLKVSVHRAIKALRALMGGE